MTSLDGSPVGIEATRAVPDATRFGSRAGEPGRAPTRCLESLLGGATRVDTGDLYRLINRIVEVALDTEALADLALVSFEGSDPR